MKKYIAQYPGYVFIDDEVYSPTGKKLKLSDRGTYRVVNEQGIRTSVSVSSIANKLNDRIALPMGSKPIPNTGGIYYISKDARVFSFDKNLSPQGTELSVYKRPDKYVSVGITFNTGRRSVDVHYLMAITFIQENYSEEGLCCMHLDDNKHNNNLANLRVSTYS